MILGKSRAFTELNFLMLPVEVYVKKYRDYCHEDIMASIITAFRKVRDELKIKPESKGSGSRPDMYTKAQLDKIFAHGKDKLPPPKRAKQHFSAP